jgi:hypothetical protein
MVATAAVQATSGNSLLAAWTKLCPHCLRSGPFDFLIDRFGRCSRDRIGARHRTLGMHAGPRIGRLPANRASISNGRHDRRSQFFFVHCISSGGKTNLPVITRHYSLRRRIARSAPTAPRGSNRPIKRRRVTRKAVAFSWPIQFAPIYGEAVTIWTVSGRPAEKKERTSSR